MEKEKNSEYILPEYKFKGKSIFEDMFKELIFFCIECKTQLIDIAYYDSIKGYLCEKCAWRLE